MKQVLEFTILNFQLISSVRQHGLDALLVALGNDRIYIEIAFTFMCFACQNMARMAVSPLELARGSRAKTLCRALVCFKFRHNCFSRSVAPFGPRFASLSGVVKKLKYLVRVFHRCSGNRRFGSRLATFLGLLDSRLLGRRRR